MNPRKAVLALLLAPLAAPAAASPPVCAAPTVLRSEKGSNLLWAEHDQNVTQTRLLCAAEVEDFPTACANGTILGSNGSRVICTSSGAGSVTSVAMTVPAGFTLSGSPITSSGTFSFGLGSIAANLVAAGPSSGGSAAWGFRTLVAADIPALPYLSAAINYAGSASQGGAATTALALAANGTNCDSGFYARGVDASGNAESCTAEPTGVTDHGLLFGLGDDDHAQYPLLAGRAGGQTINGGTAAGEDLTLRGTSNGTAGSVIISAGDLQLPAAFGSSASLRIGSTDTGLKDATGNGQITLRSAGTDLLDYVPGLGWRMIGGTINLYLAGQANFGSQVGNRLNFGGGNGLKIYGEGAGGTEQHVGKIAGDFTAVSRGLGTYVPVRPSTAVCASPLALTDDHVGQVLTNAGATARACFNLPAAQAGSNYSWIVVDTDGARVTAATGDTIRVGSAVSTTGGFCEASTDGDSLELIAVDGDRWYARNFIGAWTCS